MKIFGLLHDQVTIAEKMIAHMDSDGGWKGGDGEVPGPGRVIDRMRYGEAVKEDRQKSKNKNNFKRSVYHVKQVKRA